jgi:serine/threonine protein kinase
METKEIIHRDIKPANLLINKDGYVKLCDFGISRSFAQMDLYFNNLNDVQYCQLSPLLHTENYMPPTIKGGIQDDMWSLGITLLEVVSGQNPFAREGEDAIHPHPRTLTHTLALMRWEPSIPEIICNNMQQLILHL